MEEGFLGKGLEKLRKKFIDPRVEGEPEAPAAPEQPPGTGTVLADPDPGPTAEEPQAEIAYIARPKWKAFEAEILKLVGDPKKTKKLLAQIKAQLFANNVKFGIGPQGAVTEAATAGQQGIQFKQMSTIMHNIAQNADGYYSTRTPSALKQFWVLQTQTPKGRFQGWSSKQLKTLRDMVKKAAAATKEYMQDESFKERHRAKGQIALPMMTKFGQVIDATRKGQRATDQRRAQAMAAKPGVQGKEVVTQPGKFMISGMNMFMARNLGLHRGQLKSVGHALTKFVRANTKLQLSENWFEENLKRNEMIRRMIVEETAAVLKER